MPRVDEPLEKVTLNLYAKDVAFMRDRHGYGYTEVIRQILRRHINKLEKEHEGEEAFHGQ